MLSLEPQEFVPIIAPITALTRREGSGAVRVGTRVSPEARIPCLLVDAGPLLAPGSVEPGATYSNPRSTGCATAGTAWPLSPSSGSLRRRDRADRGFRKRRKRATGSLAEAPTSVAPIGHEQPRQRRRSEYPREHERRAGPPREQKPASRQSRNSRRRQPSTASAASARGPALARQQGGQRLAWFALI
jgi:hypothetical protein